MQGRETSWEVDEQSDGITLVFSGFYNEQIVASLKSELECRLTALSFERRVINNIIFVFVELAQNIQRYSSEIHHDARESEDPRCRQGVVAIELWGSRKIITCWNPVDNDIAGIYLKYLKAIQENTRDKLKTLYKTARRSQPPPYSKGGGLGLMEVALSCADEVQYTPKSEGALQGYEVKFVIT